jgi:hypothetical protein
MPVVTRAGIVAAALRDMVQPCAAAVLRLRHEQAAPQRAHA